MACSHTVTAPRLTGFGMRVHIVCTHRPETGGTGHPGHAAARAEVLHRARRTVTPAPPVDDDMTELGQRVRTTDEAAVEDDAGADTG